MSYRLEATEPVDEGVRRVAGEQIERSLAELSNDDLGPHEKALAVRKGERVLDLCAAPGGKTMQLAAAGAKVTAVDISDMRMHRIRENLNRVRLNANLLVEDVLDWQPAETFAAILLDAPCSATGTIRRHPDLPFVKAGVDMSLLFKMQADMIDAAFAMLAGGGRLVYCTCSLLPREGETQVEQALARHPDMRVMPFDAVGLGVDPDWVTPEGGLRLRPDYWPELGGMDGFYLALLQKS